MNNKPIIIYHAHCMDGFTALWCANLYFGGNIESFAAKNGREDIPENIDGRDVCIVDYAYPKHILLDINKRANSLVVLDHHETSRKYLEGLDFCQFDMNRSGAGMAWDYFFPNKPRPWIVDYVEDQDIWKWEHPDSKDICSYLNSLEKDLEQWTFLYENPEESLEKARTFGKIINQTVDNYCNVTMGMGQLGEIAGYVVPIVNCPFFAASTLLNKMCSLRLKDGSWPLFAVGWHVNEYGQVKYSLRSTENPETGEAFNVAELAEQFGGGGHKKASAFRVKGVDYLVHKGLKPMGYEK